jgi:hypothetical protein
MSLAYLLLFFQSIEVRLGFRPASAGVWSERGSPWPQATSDVVRAVDTRRDKSPGDQCRGGPRVLGIVSRTGGSPKADEAFPR